MATSAARSPVEANARLRASLRVRVHLRLALALALGGGAAVGVPVGEPMVTRDDAITVLAPRYEQDALVQYRRLVRAGELDAARDLLAWLGQRKYEARTVLHLDGSRNWKNPPPPPRRPK